MPQRLSAPPPSPAANPTPASDADPFPITVWVLPGIVLGPAKSDMLRNFIDKATAKADYTLKIKACNPGCK